MFQVLKYKLNPFWTLVYKQDYLVNSPYKITYTGKFKVGISLPTGRHSHSYYVFQKVK
jgi:hypothetical protein